MVVLPGGVCTCVRSAIVTKCHYHCDLLICSIVHGCAGDRQCSVKVLPHQDTHVAWRLVAYAAGALSLPEVKLSAVRQGASVEVSNGKKLFVLPAPV